MKTLILLRHAKSDWSASDHIENYKNDISRPLSPRGYKTCQTISKFFEVKKTRVDLVEYSSARRAVETFKLVKNSLIFSVSRENSELYTFESGRLMQLIATRPDNVSALLVIGHNPAIENLVCKLIPTDTKSTDFILLRAKYPTGALAFLRLNIQAWREITENCGTLTKFVRPKDLEI